MDHNPVDAGALFSVKDMVVVITGGATGIGLMMTKAFANNGASKVYIVGRRKEKLEEAARTASPHGNVVPVVGDVTSKEDLTRIADQVKKEVGFVNLLVCNSGIMPPAPGVKASDVSVQEFAKRCMDMDPEAGFSVNTTSVAFTSFAFLELLDAGNKKANSPGHKSQILVTTSIAGYLRVPANFSAYPLTKAATTHLIKCLSGVLVPYSIRVNGIAPGLFPSELADGIITANGGKPGEDPSIEGAFPKTIIPAGRTGSTADMAGTVLYMASAAGAYLNGNITVLDGGRITQMPGTY